jgi:hypothetical protein
VKTALETSEDLSSYAGQTSEYRVAKSLMAPTGAPLLRLENDGGANWGLQGGFYVFAQDYVEKNSFFGLTYLGDDSLVFGEYQFQGFWPTLGLDAYVYQGKEGDGFIVDVDNDPSTTTSDERCTSGSSRTRSPTPSRSSRTRGTIASTSTSASSSSST